MLILIKSIIIQDLLGSIKLEKPNPSMHAMQNCEHHTLFKQVKETRFSL